MEVNESDKFVDVVCTMSRMNGVGQGYVILDVVTQILIRFFNLEMFSS